MFQINFSYDSKFPITEIKYKDNNNDIVDVYPDNYFWTMFDSLHKDNNPPYTINV